MPILKSKQAKVKYIALILRLNKLICIIHVFYRKNFDRYNLIIILIHYKC